MLEWKTTQCFSRTFFMQNGTNPLISLYFVAFVISFCRRWCHHSSPFRFSPPRSSDLNRYDFRLWENWKISNVMIIGKMYRILKTALHNMFLIFLLTHSDDLLNMPFCGPRLYLTKTDFMLDRFCCNKIYKFS